MDPLKPPKAYPGRNRVISREGAREILWRRDVVQTPEDPATACSQPLNLPAIGLPSFQEAQSPPLTLEIPARCRQCPACLEHRRRLWTARARDMIRVSRRTWFGTLTVRPEERFKMRLRAEAKRLRAGRETIGSLSDTEQFRLLADELGSELTRWLKRLRASDCGAFRYLAVTEEHKSGDPHIHCLLHEFADPIPKRVLEEKWRYGFSQFRLVGADDRAARYVTKYLSKDLRTRVRASLGYGQADAIRLLTERIEAARDAVLSVPRASVERGETTTKTDNASLPNEERNDDERP